MLFERNMYFDVKMMFVCTFVIFSLFSCSIVGVNCDAADVQITSKLNVKMQQKSFDKLVDKVALQIKKEYVSTLTSRKVTNPTIPVTNTPTAVSPVTNPPFPANIPQNLPAGSVPGYVYAGPIYLPVMYPPPQMIVPQNQPAPYRQQTEMNKDMDTLVKNFERILNLNHNMLVKVQSYPVCDSYEEITKTCWLDKQLGSQLKLRPKFFDMQGRELDLQDLHVTWQKRYKIYKLTETSDKEITDNFQENNIKFGRNRGTLNLQPLEEGDMDFNSFILTVRLDPSSSGGDKTVLAKITYRIRILPIDMGFIKDGERLSIDITNYITLPKEEVLLEWFIERGNEQTEIPSNMEVSENGQILTVKEFRHRKVSTVIVCTMYYKKTGIFHAKRRFLIRTNSVSRKLNRQSTKKRIFDGTKSTTVATKKT